VPALVVGAAALLLGAAAFAATEAAAVPTYWRGLLWSLSLLTTVGFVDAPPTSIAGQVVAALLMTFGFVLLSLVSAALASLFVREDEQPSQQEQHVLTEQVLRQLDVMAARLEALQARLDAVPELPPEVGQR
jgi:voltage-gated potassium channel